MGLAWCRAPQVQVFRATRAWALGIQIFNTELTKDKRKRILVAAASSEVVATASTNALTGWAPALTAAAAGNAAYNQPEAPSPLALLLKDTRDAAERCDEKKSGVRKKLELIFSTLNRYADCVDVLIQQHPDTTAIAWGIIRMLVTVSPCRPFYYLQGIEGLDRLQYYLTPPRLPPATKTHRSD